MTTILGGSVRFSPGQIASTPGALALLEKHGIDPGTLLMRHLKGDWGVLDAEDVHTNNEALRIGLRVMSNYPVGNTGDRVWIITEADRSVTTILLPSEY